MEDFLERGQSLVGGLLALASGESIDMKRATKATVALAVFAVVAALGSGMVLPKSTHAQQITIAGSSTVKPVVDEAVKLYGKSHPDLKFVVGAGGSGQGIKAVAKGEVQIGMSSRDLRDAEKAESPDLVATRIGLDGIALVVHKNNAVKSITTQQVVDVFTGKIKNWKELGGADADIVLVAPNSKHGTYEAFVEHFKMEGKDEGGTICFKPKGSDTTGPAVKSVDGNNAALAAVMTQPHALAFASLGTAAGLVARGSPIRLLDLDGVAGTEENVLSGSYKLQRPLLVLTKGEPTGPVKAFIDFLTGAEGQQIVKTLGFIPVRN